MRRRAHHRDEGAVCSAEVSTLPHTLVCPAPLFTHWCAPLCYSYTGVPRYVIHKLVCPTLSHYTALSAPGANTAMVLFLAASSGQKSRAPELLPELCQSSTALVLVLDRAGPSSSGNLLLLNDAQ